MIERLRQMERLSGSEERRIDRKLRIINIAAAAVVLTYLIISIVRKSYTGPVYYTVLVVFLVGTWLVQDLSPIWVKRALAGRTDEQVQAYLKSIAFDLAGYCGLGWFLFSMNSNSLFGAIIYFIAVTSARKQRDIYNGTAGNEKTETKEETEEDIIDPDQLPGASDRTLREDADEGSAEDSNGSV